MRVRPGDAEQGPSWQRRLADSKAGPQDVKWKAGRRSGWWAPSMRPNHCGNVGSLSHRRSECMEGHGPYCGPAKRGQTNQRQGKKKGNPKKSTSLNAPALGSATKNPIDQSEKRQNWANFPSRLYCSKDLFWIRYLTTTLGSAELGPLGWVVSWCGRAMCLSPGSSLGRVAWPD